LLVRRGIFQALAAQRALFPFEALYVFYRTSCRYGIDRPPFSRNTPDPATNAVAGRTSGAATGAVIGCIVTIPVGCAPARQ